MRERRNNWKENLGKQAKARNEKRQALLIRKEEISKAIRQAGLDFTLYDELKQQQREVIAELATL